YGVLFSIAKMLCNAWDDHKYTRTFEYVLRYTPKEIIDNCDSLRTNEIELKKYLKSCVDNGDISKVFSKKLFKEYRKQKN
ncbi:MAG: hypothetical protein IJW06_02085, partial [Clostridia bacterium]|nr:hypothetical protein [Clostridia bacterium]